MNRFINLSRPVLPLLTLCLGVACQEAKAPAKTLPAAPAKVAAPAPKAPAAPEAKPVAKAEVAATAMGAESGADEAMPPCHGPGSKGHADKAPETAAAPIPLPGESVYRVTSQWKDQGGKSIKLERFRGKLVVTSMVFTHCRYACPRLVADMQKIERGLSDEERAKVHFLLVSMDPERDTPERMTEFAGKHKLDLKRWTIMTGPPGDVRVFSAVLGGRYKKTPSGDFAHSNLVCVLDRNGVIVHRQEGLELAPDGALAALRKAIAGKE